MSTFKDILEQIREQEKINVPDSIKFNKEYSKSIKTLISNVNEYNRTKDSEKLKMTLIQSLRLIEEILEKQLKKDYETKYELKKKNYLIAKFKQYIADKDDLDAELPDDDDKKTPGVKLKDPSNPSDAEIARISKMI